MRNAIVRSAVLAAGLAPTTTSEIGEGNVNTGLALHLAAVGAQRAACLRSTC